MHGKGRLFSAVLIMALAVGRLAAAGGFEIPDNIARAMGRGGAYASSVMEPSALFYNPAALSLIDGFAVTGNLNLWFFHNSFQRAPFTTEVLTGIERTYPFEEAKNLDPLFLAPAFFVSYDFGLEDWGFGLGVYGPSAIGHQRYNAPDLAVLADIDNRDTSPRDWGHAYMIEESNTMMLFFSGAAAYNFGPLQLGLTLQLAWMNAEFCSASDGGGTFDPMDHSREEPSLYTRSQVEVSGLTPTGIIAIRYQPILPLTLSLSYRPRFTFEADGTFQTTLPSMLADRVSFTGNGATLKMTVADVVRFGARWAFRRAGLELADVELDLVYENWSVMDTFTVDIDSAITIDLTGQVRQIPTRVIPRRFNDTLSVRLGSDVRVTDALTLRAGGYYEGAANSHFFEQGSSRPGFTSLDYDPFNRLAVTLGGSYRLGDLSINLAYMHVFSPTVEEKNGQIPIYYPQWICNDPQTQADVDACNARTTSAVHAVNNGTYNVSYDLVSLGLTYHWTP
ncbi:MAG: outer membrane protein transport protein [Bradymonadales bacterium]|nr:outer membrane protein transport protein [Bradymonadales bacterium]